MKRKDINKHKYLFVFLVSTAIFLIGVLFGYMLMSMKISGIGGLEDELRTDTMALEIQYLVMAENPCAAVNASSLNEELYTIASRLDYMESRLGQTNEDVLRIKNYYSLIELRQWLYLMKAKKECNNTYNLILYFYSDKESCPKCEEQGFILTYIRKKYQDVNIYSFDVNIDNPALDTIKEIYKIEETPTIVVDEKTYPGFHTKAEVEEILNAS